jgi:hypothetical protein
LPDKLQLTIASESARPPIKRSLDVVLSRKVSEQELKQVALYLRGQDGREYERTFILYYLPGMTVGAGAWARTFFEPELKLQILGTTLEDEASLVPTTNRPHTVIGTWFDERAGAARVMMIVEADGVYRMLQKFKDGGSVDALLEETLRQDGRCFREREAPRGDHFVLLPNGALELRDEDGLITTLPKR